MRPLHAIRADRPSTTNRDRRAVRPRHRGARDGFTVLELAVVSALMGILIAVLMATWSAFGQPAVDVVTRVQLTREARMAVESLATDLSGHLPDDIEAGLPLRDARFGPIAKGRLLDWSHPGDTQLWLCFDGTNPNGLADWSGTDVVVTYRVVGQTLVRTNQATGDAIPIADNVRAMAVTDLDGRFRIQIEFGYRDLTRTYTIEAYDP